MAETTEQTQEFNPVEFIKARNAGTKPNGGPPAKPAEAKIEPKTEQVSPPADPERKMPRSERRAMNHLHQELGAERARREALETRLAALEKPDGVSRETKSEDPEPARKDFATDAEYNRAMGKWDARQEATKVVGKTQAQKDEIESLKAQIAEADAKAVEDRALFSDWDKVAEEAAADEDAPTFDPSEHGLLTHMLAISDVKARILYHLAKNPDVLEKLLELTGDNAKQIRAFQRLEGQMEVLYTPKQKAAQAAEEKAPPKDRTHPAEGEPKGEPGRKPLPKPSSEVSARGGSAPPEEPVIGSREWMARRNQAQYGR